MELYITTATCCRQWPVMAFNQIRRCGYCGCVPVVTSFDLEVVEYTP